MPDAPPEDPAPAPPPPAAAPRAPGEVLRAFGAGWMVASVALLAGGYFLCSYEFFRLGLFAPYASPLEGAPAAVGPPPADASAAEPALARSLVLFMVDGLRDDAVRPDLMPHTVALGERGARLTARHATPTFTRPGLAALMTGAPPVITGVTSNERRGPLAMDSLLAAARRAGLRTLLLTSGNRWLVELFPDGFAQVADYHGAPYETFARLSRGELGRCLVVIYLGWPDHEAHLWGAESDRYRRVCAEVDEKHIRPITSVMSLDRDAVIVTADHGHLDRGGHGGDETVVERVPVVLAGAGVRAGAALDRAGAPYVGGVTSTAARLLGLPPPALAVEPAFTDLLALDAPRRAALEQAETARLARVGETVERAGLSADLAAALGEGDLVRAAPLGLLALAVLALAGLAVGWRGEARALLPGAIGTLAFFVLYGPVAGEATTFSIVNESAHLPAYVLRSCAIAAVAMLLGALAAAPVLRRGGAAIAPARLASAHVLVPAALALALLPFGGPAMPPAAPGAAMPYLLALLLLGVTAALVPLWWVAFGLLAPRARTAA